MKIKLLTVILCLLLCSTITGCGGGNAASSASNAPVVVEESAKGDTELMPNAVNNTPTVDLSAGPATILPRLQKAYNGQDMYAIVECFDPAGANAFFGMAKLLGFEADALKSVMPFFSTALGASGVLDNSSWGTVTLTAKNYEINGTDASLSYNVSLKMDDGSVNSFDETIDCVLVEDIWYISLTQATNAGLYQPTSAEPIPVHDDVTEADVAELYTFKENGAVGILNQSAKVIIDPFFQEVGTLEYDYIPVKKGGRWGFMDRMGNLVVDYQFQDIRIEAGHSDGDGYFEIKHEDKWGLFNVATGKAIPCIYDDIGEFSGGVAPAKLDGFWGVIDEDGNTVAEFIYDDMIGGNGRTIGVWFNDSFGVIDIHGNYVIPLGGIDIKKETEIYGFPGNACSGKVLEIEESYIVVEVCYGQEAIYNIAAGQYLDISEEDRTCDLSWGNKAQKIDFLGCLGDSYVFSLSFSNGLDSRNNILGIDQSGNVTFNLEEQLGGNNGMIRGEWLSEGKLLKIRANNFGLETYGETESIYNILTEDGTFLLDKWLDRNPFRFGNYIWTCSSADKRTEVFSIEGETIVSIDDLYNWADEYGVIAGIYSQNIRYYNFVSGETKTFDVEFNYTENVGSNGQCEIFYDGIFYGVFVGTGDGGLVGAGMAYHSVDYDENADFYTLSLGTNKERFRIGRDGTIVQLP